MGVPSWLCVVHACVWIWVSLWGDFLEQITGAIDVAYEGDGHVLTLTFDLCRAPPTLAQAHPYPSLMPGASSDWLEGSLSACEGGWLCGGGVAPPIKEVGHAIVVRVWRSLTEWHWCHCVRFDAVRAVLFKCQCLWTFSVQSLEMGFLEVVMFWVCLISSVPAWRKQRSSNEELKHLHCDSDLLADRLATPCTQWYAHVS